MTTLHTQNIYEMADWSNARVAIYIDNRKKTKTLYRVDGAYYVKHNCEIVEVEKVKTTKGYRWVNKKEEVDRELVIKARDERVVVEQLTSSRIKGQWMAYDYNGTPLCYRPTKTEALVKGIEMARRKRMVVCGFC